MRLHTNTWMDRGEKSLDNDVAPEECLQADHCMHGSPRQALMWRCLRRKQADQARHVRKTAAEALAARLQSAVARRRHASTLSGAASLLAAMARAAPHRAHAQHSGAALRLEADVRAAMAGREWVARSAAGKLLSRAVGAVALRNKAVEKMQSIVRSVLVCATAWRSRQARLRLEHERRLKQERAARVRLERARAKAASTLETSLKRRALQHEWRHRVQAARTLALVNSRSCQRRALSLLLAAGSVVCSYVRVAHARRQMMSRRSAARQLAATAARSIARSGYRRTVAGHYAAGLMATSLSRNIYIRRHAAARNSICPAAAARAARSRYGALKSATCEMQLVLRSCAQRAAFAGMVRCARVLEAALRRMPVRAWFARDVGAAATIRRGFLGRSARLELKRRKDQRARDALLAPALVPSKQPALHEHLSPCPPRASRPDAQRPPAFRKRLFHSGSATSCRADSNAPPLKGCKVPSCSRDGGPGDVSDGGESSDQDDTRDSRLLQQQQQRISEDIARAGGTRAPKDAGIFAHEVVQGGPGAALLALRTRNRG